MQIIDPIEFAIARAIPVGEIIINWRDNPLYGRLERPAAVLFTDPTDTTVLSVHKTIKASQIVWDQENNDDGLLRQLPGVGREEFRCYLVRIALTCNVEKAETLKAQAIEHLHPQYMTGAAEN